MNQVPHPIDVTDEIIEEHGLSKDEFSRVIEILGRTPSITELGVFSVMWSEHCSYKSSRLHLSKLHTEGDHVICGPGENAGVIDIGDTHAAIFKMESHNHPSFIEPYQGAATGVGGIMRDVFTMGARPVALMNALRFGEEGHKKTRHLVSGVVAGIGGYGNCMGVPTVGLAWQTKTISFIQLRQVLAIQLSMWALKQAATAFTVPLWPQQNLMTTRKKNVPLCKLATRSPKNYSLKPVLS